MEVRGASERAVEEITSKNVFELQQKLVAALPDGSVKDVACDVLGRQPLWWHSTEPVPMPEHMPFTANVCVVKARKGGFWSSVSVL